MGIEESDDFRQDIFGLQTALDVLDNCQTQADRRHVLGLILLVLERLEIQIQDELNQTK